LKRGTPRGIPLLDEKSVLFRIGKSRKEEINRKRNGSFTTDSNFAKRREREKVIKEGDKSRSKSSSTLPQPTTVPQKSFSFLSLLKPKERE